jgi:hypothetical protein
MAKTIRSLVTIVALAATPSATAATPQENELLACLTAAATRHLQAKTALFSSAGLGTGKGGIPQLTVDFYMSQRRIDETYCLEYARCNVAFTKPSVELAGIVAGAQFASCLAEEAKEGTDADDK